jgi:hypothetical protein
MEVHMKRMGWFVAGVASAAGAVAAGVAVRSRRHHQTEDAPVVTEAAPVAEPEAAPEPEVARSVVPPPDDAATDAMRSQIGDARMRLREKAEAGVPEPANGGV